MEINNIVSMKIKKDKKFIFLSMLSWYGTIIFFTILFTGILYIAIFDTDERSESNLNAVRYFWLPCMALFFIYAASLNFKFIRLNLCLKKDIHNCDINEKTLSNIIKVRPIREYHYRMRSNIGFIIYNLEEEKIIKYYLFSRGEQISSRANFDLLKNMRIDIKYYSRSKYIISTPQKAQILKSVR